MNRVHTPSLAPFSCKKNVSPTMLAPMLCGGERKILRVRNRSKVTCSIASPSSTFTQGTTYAWNTRVVMRAP